MILYLIQAVGLSVLDHLLGSIFGLVRGMVISMLLAILLHSLHLDEDTWWKRSVLAPYLDHLIAQVSAFAGCIISNLSALSSRGRCQQTCHHSAGSGQKCLVVLQIIGCYVVAEIFF